MIKKLKLKISIPKQKDYDTQLEFDKAYKEFYRKISKYLQGETVSQHMNVTSIGSSYDKFEASLKEKFLELVKFNKQLAVKVSDKDLQLGKRNMLLKTIMMKLDEKQLIECSTEVEILLTQTSQREKTELSPTVIEKIKNYYANFKKIDVNGVITESLRSKNVKEFIKEIPNETLMKSLETEIFTTSPDYITYVSKINDILFIFKNYPNFKKFLLESKISVSQLVFFEKEIMFEALIGVTTIKNRRNVVKYIKETLLQKEIYKNKIVNNYKCNVFAKRFELLVLDISSNEQSYNKLIDKLIKFIKAQDNIFEIKLEDILLQITSEKGTKVKENYSKLNQNDITALMSQTKLSLDNILEKMKIVENDILNWKCPRKVLTREREKWESVLQQGKLNEIVKFRKYLLNKYNLPEDYRLIDLKDKLRSTKKKYSNLKKFNLILQEKEKQKYEDILTVYPKTIYTPITFERDNVMINELIQLYKRRLMIDSLDLPEPDKIKLIDLIELVDINDLIAKNHLLQKRLLVDITNLLPSGYNYFDFNKYYYTASLEAIKPYLNENTIIFTRDQSGLIDYYGNDIFYKVYNSATPEDIYKDSIQKEYYRLNSKTKIEVEPEYRRLRILYNPYTGKFGKEAYDGYVFEVEKLRKGQNGQPIEDFVMHESIDPRTNQMVYKRIKVPIQGNDPFIKIPILTSKKDEQKFTWVSVKKEQTVMLTGNYDSCSRNDNKETECNSSKGLGNSACVYNQQSKKCKANYTQFGKKKVKFILKKESSGIKYNLKMPQKQRRNALIKRIIFEGKKLKIKPRQAAIKVKKRLVVLRTFRKNNLRFKKQVSLLNSDINFINKKFKI
jgi:hypothetical protein